MHFRVAHPLPSEGAWTNVFGIRKLPEFSALVTRRSWFRGKFGWCCYLGDSIEAVNRYVRRDVCTGMCAQVGGAKPRFSSMRSLTGLLLLIAGLVVGAQAYYPDTVERHVHIAQVARILTPAAPNRRITEDSITPAVRSFSPGNRLVTTGSIARSDNVKLVVAPASPVLKSAPKLVRSDPWGARVVKSGLAQDRSGRLGQRSLSGADRWRLVRDIQTELRRLGCYWGKIDGSWGGGSKNSLARFLRSVNATLPTDKPDHIMLSLLRSHKVHARSPQRRCRPREIIAQRPQGQAEKIVAPAARLVRSGSINNNDSVRAQAAVDLNRTARTNRVQRRKNAFEGRMAVGGPPPGRIGARYSARGVSAVPSVVRPTPRPVSRAKPVKRPKIRKKRAIRKTPKRRIKKSRKYRRVASKRARRRALMRQAFGESFD